MFLRSAISILCLSTAILSGSSAWAGSDDMQNMHHSMHHAGTESASTKAYEAAMATMHQRMSAPLSGDADVDFARQMLPHHQGAVAMANIELQYGHDEQLKVFSRWVIRAQEKEIAFLENWLERRDNGAHPAQAKDYYGPSMMAMHSSTMLDYTGDADVDFARGMIPHHQGAVAMSAILFHDGKDFELNRLAKDIYSSQSYEISLLQNWLAAHDGK